MIRCLFCCLVLLTLSSCHVGRYFIWNFADYKDYKKFPKQVVEKGSGPAFQFAYDTSNKAMPQSLGYKGEQLPFDAFLEATHTNAFIVIRRDTIIYEGYFGKQTDTTPHVSFSMAKSFVSALVGIAVEEGAIASIDEPMQTYLPELSGEGFELVTIRHLLDMRSGIYFNEGYSNPFGSVAQLYYGRNIDDVIKKLEMQYVPDQDFEYQSISTQLLGEIVERATGQPLHQYLSQKLWSHMDMESDATWSIDSKKHGHVKAFCCLNARARDFAKFGRLYLNDGQWEGEQLVPAEWVEASTRTREIKNDWSYARQWWHHVDVRPFVDSTQLSQPYRVYLDNGVKQVVQPTSSFAAKGILGQYIFVQPEKEVIIVRLGKKTSNVRWMRFMHRLAMQL